MSTESQGEVLTYQNVVTAGGAEATVAVVEHPLEEIPPEQTGGPEVDNVNGRAVVAAAAGILALSDVASQEFTEMATIVTDPAMADQRAHYGATRLPLDMVKSGIVTSSGAPIHRPDAPSITYVGPGGGRRNPMLDSDNPLSSVRIS